ncbi:Condensin complex subunit 2 [Trachymyrmex septentrionalis]|uniref:Condensin complex subunit 2 n=1 Tax=Trachymyrmex septentrionalis TaxID=34720 RepID=A0A195ET80_9HYME|nr:Condensin complex subunit 2 [Trachymyrmex septentrionalis]
MDSHKSIMHKRLESIQNSPNSSSPLRRKSIVQISSVPNLSENDDEAERIARRREIFTTSPSNGKSNGKRLSLGLGFLANIPAPQMAESMNKCIQLNAENKINIKNAFSLEMIDFMTYMIKKQDVNMSNLLVASTSLDVSTKIYGYRVDNVHMEILKMVGGLDKQVMVNMEKNSDQEENAQEDAENVEVPKKKKKSKQKIFSTVEALRGNIEIAKPMSTMIGEGDLQTSDMLYQAMLPNHANSGFYLHQYNDVLVDVLENKPESQNNSNVKYVIPAIEDFSNLEICTSYSNFEFLEVHNVRASEYSFIQPNMNLHWAGPSHWKFWNFMKSPAVDRGAKVACMQAKTKEKRKQFQLLYDEARDIIDAKFASKSHTVKLHAKTAKAEWSAENLTLPEDVHYDITQGSKLYMYKKLTIKESSEKENAVNVADVSDGERYDYNNPNDTLEYCPNVEHNEDYDDYGREDGNFDDSAVMDNQGLTGDNLVAAPKLINKISIAYCLKAKKIDMRQLKKSIWTCLKSTNNNETNTGQTVDVTDTMKESKQFSDVYKALPKLLTKSNAEALSVPISFISMLHLANEKELKICSVPDMSDIIIQSGSPSLK